ncbi:hypothetical protein [Brucella melitensis]|uniref:hypothetical protein n=1 Tax=Brucella melitensis TaxID=29459 RepID=UPI0032BF4726
MNKFVMPLEDYNVFASREETRMITVEMPEIGPAIISHEGKPDIRVTVRKVAPLYLNGNTFHVSRIEYRTFSVKGEK